MHSIIKKDHVRSVASGGAPAQKRGTPAASGCEQGVRLLSENGLVHAIEITCSCGETALVELDYPAAPESTQ